jgi:hypothetical protein
MKKKYSNSVRKFIRTEKARIRRLFFDVKKQNDAIAELYKKLSEKAVKLEKVPEAKKEAKGKPEKKVKGKK